MRGIKRNVPFRIEEKSSVNKLPNVTLINLTMSSCILIAFYIDVSENVSLLSYRASCHFWCSCCSLTIRLLSGCRGRGMLAVPMPNCIVLSNLGKIYVLIGLRAQLKPHRKVLLVRSPFSGS